MNSLRREQRSLKGGGRALYERLIRSSRAGNSHRKVAIQSSLSHHWLCKGYRPVVCLSPNLPKEGVSEIRWRGERALPESGIMIIDDRTKPRTRSAFSTPFHSLISSVDSA